MHHRKLSASAENALDQKHPLRSAFWIWPGGQMYNYNTYAQFRKEFTLAGVPRRAPFFITADQSYRLWVNGEYVCRGPARGYQSHWPFDEADLAPYLRTGLNWIAVQAYNPGIGTFQYRHQSFAGMLCAGHWGNVHIISDGTWKQRRDPDAKTMTARYSLQLAFQEHVTCTPDSWDWVSAEAPDLSAWEHAREHATAWDGMAAFGRAPCDTVEARGIPNLGSCLRTPCGVVSVAQGECAQGWQDWENVSWPWVAEAQDADWSKRGEIACESAGEFAQLDIPASGSGRWRAVLLSFPEYCAGHLTLCVEGGCGGEIIDLHYYEAIEGCRPAMHRPGDACQVALANRMRIGKGRCRHEFFHINGFRYAAIVTRNCDAALRVRVCARHYGYPFTMRGKFECSDSLLVDIVDACRRTQRICSLDSYVDTPWREQAQWWGDARVQARNTFYLDGDARLLARGIRSIAGQSTAAGLTFGHAPTIAYNCILPDFSLTWILTIRDYWWQTGDIALLREQWPRVREVLAYFDTPEARHRSGLLRHDTRYWYFGDWSYIYKGEVPTLLNLWYLLTLRALEELLAVAHMSRERTALGRRAREHEQLVMELLYDKKRRCFLGGLDRNGRPGTHIDSSGRRVLHLSVHDQTAALMLGLAPETHRHLLESFLLAYFRDEPSEGRGMPSAFWSTYVLEQLGLRGHGAEVVEFIRRKWAPMTATATTWENFDWHPGSGNSLSHAWSAHPSSHLVSILAGIRQTAPAWKRVDIVPQFVPGIERVSARVPSPQGDISVQWQRDGDAVELRVRCPQSVRAVLRCGATRNVVAGSLRVRCSSEAGPR